MAYDAMFGAGQRVMTHLFPKAVHLHCEVNPSFKGIAPEPLHKNLLELSETMKSSPELKFGLANDGDAIVLPYMTKMVNMLILVVFILLLIHYLHKYKQLTGKVAIAASTTLRVNKMCAMYNIPCEVTPIGF